MKSVLLFGVLFSLWTVYSAVVNVPTTYYKDSHLEVSPGQTTYFEVTPCKASTAGYKWAQMNIALPVNPTWSTNDPVVAVELSTCKYSFNASCVFATNYIWPSNFFPQVQWNWTEYLDKTGTFYIRFTAVIATVPYSFQIQFVVDGTFQSGTYDYDVFHGSSVSSNETYYELDQMALRLGETVNNFATNTYFVEFCNNGYHHSPNKNFTVVTTAGSTASRPLSQFNLYACQASYGSTCGVDKYQMADQSATGLVQLVFDDTRMNMTKGMYFTVYGIGGEIDGINGYFFTSKLHS